MTHFRIGLVTEGPTDLAVLKHLLSVHFKKVRPDIELSIGVLQPTRDATSGRTDGGWTEVYKWCLRNRPRHNSSPIFANGLDSHNNDYILIQLDSDIIDEIKGKSSRVPVPTKTCTPMVRGRFIRRTIIDWLWPAGGARDARYVPLACVEALEAWLVAGVATDSTAEARHDIQEQLGQLELRLHGRNSNKKEGKMRKKSSIYQKFCRNYLQDTARLHQNCFQFRRLVKVLKVPV